MIIDHICLYRMMPEFLYLSHEVEWDEGLILQLFIFLLTDTPGHLYSSTVLDCIFLYLHCCTECQL
uniref:Uncharacterized protein n=1 Tax=Arundo donax TaxID=35708 RepID=A0A0A9CT71_ARUDO